MPNFPASLHISLCFLFIILSSKKHKKKSNKQKQNKKKKTNKKTNTTHKEYSRNYANLLLQNGEDRDSSVQIVAHT